LAPGDGKDARGAAEGFTRSFSGQARCGKKPPQERDAWAGGVVRRAGDRPRHLVDRLATACPPGTATAPAVGATLRTPSSQPFCTGLWSGKRR